MAPAQYESAPGAPRCGDGARWLTFRNAPVRRLLAPSSTPRFTFCFQVRIDLSEGQIDFARCDTQRNLSDEGRAELKAAGDAFRAAAIPLDKVLASPYCRTRETAAYFAPRGTPSAQSSAAGSGLRVQERPLLAGDLQSEPKTAQLEQLFSQRPAPGKNTLIVAHGMTLRAVTGFAIAEGHALVLEPGNFKTIVARIAPGEWAGVASGR